jgi:hypothetical protein
VSHSVNLEPRSERGFSFSHEFLAKGSHRSDAHGWALRHFALRCVKCLTHWHGAIALPPDMLAARWGATC